MTTALKIEQLPADNSCQLNVSEFKQVVGGFHPYYANVAGLVSSVFRNPNTNTAEGAVIKALQDARDEAQSAGDVARANELQTILDQKWMAAFIGTTKPSDQIISLQP